MVQGHNPVKGWSLWGFVFVFIFVFVFVFVFAFVFFLYGLTSGVCGKIFPHTQISIFWYFEIVQIFVQII